MIEASRTEDGSQQGHLQPIQGRQPSVVELIKNFGPLAYGLMVGLLYVSGFLVMNANLARYGVLDVDFVNARYFLASASFVFYLLCFYLFAGRAVFLGKRWLREDLTAMRKLGVSSKWAPIVVLQSYLHAIFFCCMSSGLFASVAIGGAEAAAFYLALMLSFIILYPLDVLNLDIRYPRGTEIIKILTKGGAIYVFFAFGSRGVLVLLFSSYLGLFFFINQLLDTFERHGVTKDRVSFSALYAVVVLLGSAIAFGSLFYGHVSVRLGGARPQPVLVGLDEAARRALPVTPSGASNGTLEGDLIHQTASYTYVVVDGKTIRLRSTDVVTLVTSAVPASNWALNLVNLFKNAKGRQGVGAISRAVVRPELK